MNLSEEDYKHLSKADRIVSCYNCLHPVHLHQIQLYEEPDIANYLLGRKGCNFCPCLDGTSIAEHFNLE